MEQESDKKQTGYVDLGATTDQAIQISLTSRKMIANLVGDDGPEDKIRQRCVIATGDPELAPLLRFNHHPVEAGLKALEAKAQILVDIHMVEVGITKKGHKSKIRTFIGSGDPLAQDKGITRASAGVLALSEAISGNIVVIGNAPSALMALCDLMVAGSAQPALVIGVPVGFVNAAESKERLRQIKVPSISTEGTRGGTPIAVAAMNEIITMFFRSQHP